MILHGHTPETIECLDFQTKSMILDICQKGIIGPTALYTVGARLGAFSWQSKKKYSLASFWPELEEILSPDIASESEAQRQVRLITKAQRFRKRASKLRNRGKLDESTE